MKWQAHFTNASKFYIKRDKPFVDTDQFIAHQTNALPNPNQKSEHKVTELLDNLGETILQKSRNMSLNYPTIATRVYVTRCTLHFFFEPPAWPCGTMGNKVKYGLHVGKYHSITHTPPR